MFFINRYKLHKDLNWRTNHFKSRSGNIFRCHIGIKFRL